VRAAGAAAFLTKPFDESVLLTAVRNSLPNPGGMMPAGSTGEAPSASTGPQDHIQSSGPRIPESK